MTNPQVIHGKSFIQALLDSGVITKGERVRRVVIDAYATEAVLMYVERFGDTRLLEVIAASTGVEVRQSPAVSGEVSE